MRQSQIQKSEELVREYFDSLRQRVFLRKDLYQILAEKHSLWELRKTMSVDAFIDHFKKTYLKEITLTSPNYDKSYTRFVWGRDVSIHQLSLSLKPRSYFTHYTAMCFHGLTDKTPSIIYVNSEQSQKFDREADLEQESVDRAFKGKARTSKYIFIHKKWKVCCLNGINTNNLGVEEIEIEKEGKLPVTNLGRTLIDITVRPIYSGGCGEVLEAYKRAKEKISVDLLVAMLKKIKYIYPYHQAIGFYMQRAGFEVSSLNILKKIGMKYDFYLDYDIKKKMYSKEWRIYYPQNL